MRLYSVLDASTFSLIKRHREGRPSSWLMKDDDSFSSRVPTWLLTDDDRPSRELRITRS
jgi:hypothetical protein